ncbi:acyltransferase family protein [Spirillospora sp. NPDC047279]|uniref:acyltransferase family protein n=1 Tax=Spirillospora sp. NPDC047279 TaxID=3155478 RepID=UPI0033F55EA8
MRSDGAGAAEAGAAGAAAPVKPARKERDPFFDNAKFLAILLVVVGHALGSLLNVPLAKGVYMFIYMFHMPLFIVITGYFSRNWTFSSGKARKLITTVGVPYVIFETAYSLYAWLVNGGELKISLLDPYYLTWFLCALFLWRLSTPVWQQIRWPLAVALVISLLSYMTTMGGLLDIHRVVGLVPFYVLGLMLKPEHFEIIKKPMVRVLGILLLVAAFGLSFLTMDRMAKGWVYWNTSSDHLGVSNLTGLAMRLAMFTCAIVLLFSFLAIVPRRRTWFTALGAYTLYAYLLHGFLTKAISFAGLRKVDAVASPAGVLALIALSLLVGTLLCTPPVVRCTSWLLEPKLDRVFTKLRRPTPKRPTPRHAADPNGATATDGTATTPSVDKITVGAESRR